jgi:hypothetical protein
MSTNFASAELVNSLANLVESFNVAVTTFQEAGHAVPEDKPNLN